MSYNILSPIYLAWVCIYAGDYILDYFPFFCKRIFVLKEVNRFVHIGRIPHEL